MFVLSAMVLLVAGFAFADRLAGNGSDGSDIRAMLATVGLGMALGAALVFAGRGSTETVGQREALLLVAASWIVGGAVAAMPFRFWALLRADGAAAPHGFDSFVNCYFEAISGLTTTGSTVVEALATLPRSILLWRALTQWLGGLGIVVLFVAVLPMLGVGGRRVYRAEATGPAPDGVLPRIQDAARSLWLIYVGLTVLEIVVLRLCGMDWFPSVCHTFATLATGGFSTVDSSIAGFESTAIHITIIVFMLIAGINFGLFHHLINGNWRTVRKDAELRTYLAIVAVATIVVTADLLYGGAGPASDDRSGRSAGDALLQGMFQVVSLQTTTGFCNTDFDTWGFAAKGVLLALMFIGGCAGSTGGGIKVVRVLIAAKVILAEIEHSYRPKVVRAVKIGTTVIDSDLKRGTLAYIICIGLLFAFGTSAIMVFEGRGGTDITTAATASAATLNNIGPGLAGVGATKNYAWFTDGSKLVMCMLMVLGRLEMFAIVVLFTPKFWRAE